MSILLYSAITHARQAAPAGAQPGAGPPPTQPALGKYVDTLAALVPAEVLAAHAAILGFTTTTTTGPDSNPVTTISDGAVLRGCFWALVVIAVLLYVAPHWGSWKSWDYARMIVPALAFVGWTMVQRSTAFDAVAPGWTANARQAVGILGAVVLAVAATALAYKAPSE
jgi:hypothetical protein